MDPIQATDSEALAQSDSERMPMNIFWCTYMSMAHRRWEMERTLIGRVQVYGVDPVMHNPRKCRCVSVGGNMDGHSVVDLRPTL